MKVLMPQQNLNKFNSRDFKRLKTFLDEKVNRYNNTEFIANDPISIPHQFTKLQDIEIIGFWTAMLSWGQRTTIINNAKTLIALMDNAPYDFIVGHTEQDVKRFAHFKHRTFNFTDTLYFLHFFQQFYAVHDSLEDAFLIQAVEKEKTVEKMLIQFHNTFFNDESASQRTRKHIATPATKSACKRINMFLRWMVRPNTTGVDFGCWKKIGTHQLICPLDVHVERVAKSLGLLDRKQTDWQAALELTENLRLFDEKDPVKYDFALFGAGVMEKWHDI